MSSEEDQKPAARQDFVPPKTESLRRRKEEDDTEVHATVSATRFARVTGGAQGETNKQKVRFSFLVRVEDARIGLLEFLRL